jgi:hypothetical protein
MWLSVPDTAQAESTPVATLSGRMVIGEHVFQLRINLPRALSLYLPEVILEGMTPQAELPHVVTGNRICFEGDANLLDRHDLWAVLWESLRSVRRVLRDMLAGNRAEEFAQEAFAYWGMLEGTASIDCIVDASEHPHRTLGLFHAGQLCAVVDDLSSYAQSLPERSADGLAQRSAIYLPLDPAAVDPSFLPKKLLTLEGLRKYIGALSEKDRGRFSLLLTQGREELLVLGVRRPQGERALLGLRLFDIQGGHPLAQERAQARLQPLRLKRRDHAFLAPRGGAGVDLRKRRVLLAGCGAVGGYLAFALARAGIGSLSLVDPDVFALENTYRHACGMAWSGYPKVLGLAAELVRAIPYLSVTRHPHRIEDLLRQQPSLLREHDLVISALGHPSVELQVNEHLWSNRKHPPAVFTWLEPLGLGGHAILTHVRGTAGLSRGCLECLYHRPIEGGAIHNRAAFASPDATYTRDTLGCGSRYLPFADLDAQRTAELAARLALRALRREAPEAQLVSWKGERQPFEAAGYTVTSRYDQEPGPGPGGYSRADCPVCVQG